MRKHIVALALKMVGCPYIWGGANPWVGLDCSGLVIWCLQVFGVLPSGDWRAQELSTMFPETDTPEAGDLAIYGRSVNEVSHVMMHVSADIVVGASGGNATTKTRADAELRGAMVKVKPLRYRSDYLFSVAIDPA